MKHMTPFRSGSVTVTTEESHGRSETEQSWGKTVTEGADGFQVGVWDEATGGGARVGTGVGPTPVDGR